MKKKEKLKFTGKLSLNKETVIILNNKEINTKIPFTLIFCTPFPPFTASVPCTATNVKSLEIMKCYTKKDECMV